MTLEIDGLNNLVATLYPIGGKGAVILEFSSNGIINKACAIYHVK